MPKMPTMPYRYILDKSPKKFICPNCGQKRYVRYWDLLENEYLPIEFGRCDREHSCTYFRKPTSLYLNKENHCHYPIPKRIIKPDYHPNYLIKAAQESIHENELVKFLKEQLGEKETLEIIEKYHLGNVPFWYNGTLFWQIDEHQRIRAGKIITYDKSGHRFGKPNWFHAYLKRKEIINKFNLKQCLFGLHLIHKKGEKDKTISIVESEKTAIVSSVIFPENLWLATGGVSANKKMFLPLKNRKIILYPDSGFSIKGPTPFQKWNALKNELSEDGFNIEISDILEKETTHEQKIQGWDLADFLLKK